MTPPPPPPMTPPPSTEQPVRFGPIVRDVAIIVALTFVGGFIIGFFGILRTQFGMLAIVISNLVLGTFGFVISGCLARGNRWRHLAYVALGVWLFGLVNVVVMGIGIIPWIFSSIAVAVMMGIGGALSCVFRSDDLPPA
jgi:hypothetical protein